MMKEFLREYFCGDDQHQEGLVKKALGSESSASEEMKRPSSEDYNGDLRMIPGGRYGCTQFLKIMGPDAIKKCSVGKTTQMV